MKNYLTEKTTYVYITLYWAEPRRVVVIYDFPPKSQTQIS